MEGGIASNSRDWQAMAGRGHRIPNDHQRLMRSIICVPLDMLVLGESKTSGSTLLLSWSIISDIIIEVDYDKSRV
jgi:hypothetical protein